MSDLTDAATLVLRHFEGKRRTSTIGRGLLEDLRAALDQHRPEPVTNLPAMYSSSLQCVWVAWTVVDARPRQLPEEEDEQEPVGWFESPHGAFRANLLYKLEFPSQLLSWSVPLYTAPPQRKPLTDVNIKGIVDLGLQTWKLSESTVEFARAIEAAHGIGGEE